jgi:hypothetical protein
VTRCRGTRSHPWSSRLFRELGQVLAVCDASHRDIAIGDHPDESVVLADRASQTLLGRRLQLGSLRATSVKGKTTSNAVKEKVWKFSLWRHGDEEGVKREHAVDSLAEMLKGLISAANKKGMKLAPFIGIGCPGIIEEDGSIDRGAQNLPGNWESSKFNLPMSLHSLIPKIGDEESSIVMHNDAVVQGLSEVPHMKDVEHWGVFTIGTGLGNARFTNRKQIDE